VFTWEVVGNDGPCSPSERDSSRGQRWPGHTPPDPTELERHLLDRVAGALAGRLVDSPSAETRGESRVNAEAPAPEVEDGGLRSCGTRRVRKSRTEVAALSERPRGRARGRRWWPWSSGPHPRANPSRTRRPPGTGGSHGRPPAECPRRRRDRRCGGAGRAGHRKVVGWARWCCGGARTHRHRGRRRPRPRGLSGRSVAPPRTNGPCSA
jgi:hypothetical protein